MTGKPTPGPRAAAFGQPRQAQWGGTATLCAALLGCAAAPPGEDAAPGELAGAPFSAPAPAAASAAPVAPTPQAAYEQQQRERALTAARQKRLADAALAWELLTVLRPDVAEYRERLAGAQRQIEAAVAERMPRALQAAQRGDIDAATRQYLAILALQPLNEPAAEALRALERERIKRNHLGRYTSTTLTRRAMAEAEMPVGASAGRGGLAGRNELEHASLLAGDGEFDDAIGLLERRLALDPKDGASRRLLADVYYLKAESLLPGDRPGAIAALQRSQRTFPAAARAATRLRQLNSLPSAPVGGALPATPAAPAASAARSGATTLAR
jgi:tetratricopeptide (TPR) repeat protein